MQNILIKKDYLIESLNNELSFVKKERNKSIFKVQELINEIDSKKQEQNQNNYANQYNSASNIFTDKDINKVTIKQLLIIHNILTYYFFSTLRKIVTLLILVYIVLTRRDLPEMKKVILFPF